MRKAIHWFSIACLIFLFGMLLWLRFSNLDMTEIRNLVTYWPEYLIAVFGVVLSGILYNRVKTP